MASWSPRQAFASLRGKKAAASVKPAMTLLPSQASKVTFLAGPVRSPQSSWVSSYGYAVRGRDSGILIQFVSGATCFYPDTPKRLYTGLANATSKGTWVHDNIYSRHYVLL
jgi:hypothetical protein